LSIETVQNVGIVQALGSFDHHIEHWQDDESRNNDLRIKFMKKEMMVLVAVGACLLALSASANSINITMSLPLNNSSVLATDVNAQAIPGSGLGDATVLAWLQSDITQYNSNLGKNLAGPTTTETAWENLNAGPSITVEAGDYLVLHYGKGQGGVGQGGGLVALYFDAAGTYQVPDNGSGPNGNGGISFARLWDHGTSVPDGGSTLVLLGAALCGLSLFAGRFRHALS
jgi:hypothetical protein